MRLAAPIVLTLAALLLLGLGRAPPHTASAADPPAPASARSARFRRRWACDRARGEPRGRAPRESDGEEERRLPGRARRRRDLRRRLRVGKARARRVAASSPLRSEGRRVVLLARG